MFYDPLIFQMRKSKLGAGPHFPSLTELVVVEPEHQEATGGT